MLSLFASLDALPDTCAPLFAAGAAQSFFCSKLWFRTVIAHAMPAGAAPCLALYAEQGRPLALFALQREAGGGLSGGGLKSLTNVYSCLWQPLIDPHADAAALRRAGAALGGFCRGFATVRIDALDERLPALAPLLRGLREGGMLARRFAHFGNWHQPVSGLSWAAYLAARPGTLRATIRRKLRAAAPGGTLAYEMIADLRGLDTGIDAYEQIYAVSWKEPEPYPRFNPALMRAAAAAGALRLGILRHAGRPVAAQYWIVAAGTAAVLKLAHDEQARSLSPGTVLSALMIRHLLDVERVGALDFGRGDDAYKQLWVAHRRQRVGYLLINPRRPGGLLALARQAAGAARRRVSGARQQRPFG